MRSIFGRMLTLAGLCVLAACAKPLPPAPPLLTPAQIPPMPIPPLGAAVGMYIPPVGVDGARKTPNSGLAQEETIWNFRSAFNVAALNCLAPDQRRLADDYNRYIAIHAAALGKANQAIDGKFRQRFPGANGLRVRDTQMTDIYNFFALPPVTSQFCAKMMVYSQQVQTIPSSELYPFSYRALIEIDKLFLDFYDDYDNYRARLAAWQALYARGRVTVEPNAAPPALPYGAPLN